MDPELVWVTDDVDDVRGGSMERLPSMKTVVSLALVAGLTFGAAIALVLLALGI
jgi:hypothetical protein